MDDIDQVLDRHLRGIPQYQRHGKSTRESGVTVVRATDLGLGRPVAMKVMRPPLSRDASHRLRFLREAQITGQLEHPNIVPVHEMGEDADGDLFITLKWVEGRTLGQALKEARDLERGSLEGSSRCSGEELRALSLGDRLNIYLKVCDAMAYAHSKGILHGDLKPDNIMVGDFGEVLVVDWGLARQIRAGFSEPPASAANPLLQGQEARLAEPGLGAAQGQGPGLLDSHPLDEVRIQDTIRYETLDESGKSGVIRTLAGTPLYMSPEQVAGRKEEIDERADVYALGALLYEILALEPAVSGQTLNEVLTQVRAGTLVSPEKRSPGRLIPRELSAIAMKALARDPKARYPSVLDLSRDVQSFLEGRAISARPESLALSAWRLVKRNRIVTVSILVALLVITAVLHRAYGRIEAAVSRAEAREMEAAAHRVRTLQAVRKMRDTALLASKENAEQAVRAMASGLQREGELWAENAERLDPGGPWGAYARAWIALQRKEEVASERGFRQALDADPAHFPSQIALAQVLARRKETQEAASLLSQIPVLKNWRYNREAGDSFSSLGQHLQARNRYEAAMEGIREARDASPADRAALQVRLESAVAWSRCDGLERQLQGLPPERQVEIVSQKLKEIHGRDISMGCQIHQGALIRLQLGHPELKFLQPLSYLTFAELDCSGTQVCDFSPLQGRPLRVLVCARTTLSDLSPLEGMPLISLECFETRVSYLQPLKGMPLTRLNCYRTAVSDLSPLRGMPLTSLNCAYTPVNDLTPLRDMPMKTLDFASTKVQEISALRGMPLNELRFNGTSVRDLSPLKGMALTSLDCSCALLETLEPLRGMPLTQLTTHYTRIVDLDPLRGMPLTQLNVGKNRISDLSPLCGMPLNMLYISQTEVSDLTPLRGMPLNRLYMNNTKVSDLSPLEGMPLTFLYGASTLVSDLRPLQGMALTALDCSGTQVQDLSVLQEMPLRDLSLGQTKVEDIRHLRGMPLVFLSLSQTEVKDLTPLQGIKIKFIKIPPKAQLTTESLELLNQLAKQGCSLDW